MSSFLLQNHNWLIALAALASGILLLWPWLTTKVSGAVTLTPLEAVQMMNRNKGLLVDVRDAAELQQGQVPQALHLPLTELTKRAAELGKNKERPLIFMCQSGKRSVLAGVVARKLGYSAVYSLEGGYPAWVKASMPVVVRS